MKSSVFTLLFLSLPSFASASSPPAARWEGKIQIPAREIKLVVDLAQDGQGQWIGSIIIPGFQVKGAPLSAIAVKDSSISFALKNAFGDPTFEGHLDSSGMLTGDFKQAGNIAPFTLRNVGPPQVEAQPVSTPVQKELEGEWKGDMNFQGREIHVTIKLTNKPDGTAAGECVIVGRRENKVPVELVTQEGALLTMQMADGVTYEGRFKKDQNQIAGEYRQGPLELPLTLHLAVKQ